MTRSAVGTFAAVVVLAPLMTLSLTGCPSKSNSTSTNATQPSASGGGTGPLANLESAPFLNEVWISQDGQQMPFIFYSAQNVRVSAPCRMGNGQLNCDAIRQMRNGMPVEIPKRTLTGNVSAGTKVCQKLGHQLVNGRNQVGSEDGFCRFPDGSMVSTGALEQYAMRVLE